MSTLIDVSTGEKRADDFPGNAGYAAKHGSVKCKWPIGDQ